ncbi:MAG: methyltransferase domain-containing protein [Alphaproteobacteria bacterium]|nr:methyltransferase domain-containing protein [Rhodospirillaceae bacterium]MBT6511175.1 methyltransferase domain-containing protein [Rhodospirillaceae bacterium]MBT7614411.1 methyltransferase domain-containing protein [Rhodospirillaceae bacterium]MDG2481877.1 methyltransferase domain-containing protein [Alphaproteobacteria bacterium]
MSDQEHENEYTDDFVGALELVWGDGFMSPGGKGELALFLEGVDLSGKEVLDVGCGVGGCDVVLAQDYGAGHVLGIDIEQPLIDRAMARAEQAGLSDRMSFQHVEPGPFPLDDASFDIVFSKDAMIHIEDKHALFKEVFRVLRPGGMFVASDWMRRDEEVPGPVAQHWIDTVGLSFGMHSPPYYVDALETAGFVDISTTDRNAFATAAMKADYELMTGEGHEELIRRTGDAADHYIAVWHAGWKAAECGELRPGHLRGTKPAG